MIPSTQCQRRQASSDVKRNIIDVKLASIIWNPSLNELGADAEHTSADYESRFESAVARGVENPVEAEREEEEGEEV